MDGFVLVNRPLINLCLILVVIGCASFLLFMLWRLKTANNQQWGSFLKKDLEKINRKEIKTAIVFFIAFISLIFFLTQIKIERSNPNPEIRFSKSNNIIIIKLEDIGDYCSDVGYIEDYAIHCYIDELFGETKLYYDSIERWENGTTLYMGLNNQSKWTIGTNMSLLNPLPAGKYVLDVKIRPPCVGEATIYNYFFTITKE